MRTHHALDGTARRDRARRSSCSPRQSCWPSCPRPSWRHARPGAADLGRTAQRAFAITGISPNSAATGEGVHATITGSGLDRTGRYEVDLIMGATDHQRRHPAGRLGRRQHDRGHLARRRAGRCLRRQGVTDQKTAETHTLAGAFTVTGSLQPQPRPESHAAKPVIASISPTKGLRGSKVTLKGSNFGKPRGAGLREVRRQEVRQVRLVERHARSSAGSRQGASSPRSRCACTRPPARATPRTSPSRRSDVSRTAGGAAATRRGAGAGCRHPAPPLLRGQYTSGTKVWSAIGGRT